MNDKLDLGEIYAANKIEFQVYGMIIRVEAENAHYLETVYQKLEQVFPNGLPRVFETSVKTINEFRFAILKSKTDGFRLFRNEEIVVSGLKKQAFFDAVESHIRLTVAEFAVSKVFLHAGVVAWKNQAIVIPATSGSGKTTLVAALVKKGAVYYSDEYAVLDEDGKVDPFPKWLSIRSRRKPFRQKNTSVETLGGVSGVETIPVKMFLLSQFKKAKKMPPKLNPKRLSPGQGLMEILPHCFAIRREPKSVLNVLDKVGTAAIIIKTERGDADEFADRLLEYFEYFIIK